MGNAKLTAADGVVLQALIFLCTERHASRENVAMVMAILREACPAASENHVWFGPVVKAAQLAIDDGAPFSQFARSEIERALNDWSLRGLGDAQEIFRAQQKESV